MFITDTFTTLMQGRKNIHYLLPYQQITIPPDVPKHTFGFSPEFGTRVSIRRNLNLRVSDPLARFARVSPSRMACQQNEQLYSPPAGREKPPRRASAIARSLNRRRQGCHFDDFLSKLVTTDESNLYRSNRRRRVYVSICRFSSAN
jgi:hypothetical protein